MDEHIQVSCGTDAAEASKKDRLLDAAEKYIARDTEQDLKIAVDFLNMIPDWKNSAELIKTCRDRITVLQREKTEAAEAERKNAIYKNALALIGQGTAESLNTAAGMLEKISDWKDSAERAEQCKHHLAELNVLAARSKVITQEKKEWQQKLTKHLVRFSVPVLIATAALCILTVCVILPRIYAGKADALLEQGNYADALTLYAKAGIFLDTAESFSVCLRETAVRSTFAAGGDYAVGITEDGAVVAVGNNEFGQCDVDSWTNIISVAAGAYHTVGLKEDGTVVAVGSNSNGQCLVGNWTDIVSIVANSHHTVGLKADGTVVATGFNLFDWRDTNNWTNIIAIADSGHHTVGLKSDGTAVAVGNNDWGQCDVDSWRDIIAIAAGYSHTLGLKRDGTVVAVGNNFAGQCNVADWTNIIAIAAGTDHSVGLRADGTVVTIGGGQHKTQDWTDVAAITASVSDTFGLKKDGSVIGTSRNLRLLHEITAWTDLRVPK